MTIAQNLTTAADAAAAEIVRLEDSLVALGADLVKANKQIGEDTVLIQGLRARIAELEGQLQDWVPVMGSHRRHNTGPVTGDGADAHFAAEEVAGRLLAFRCYSTYPMVANGVKGTTRLKALLADPERPAYIALAGGTKWADVAAGKADAALAPWRDFYADNLTGDRQWIWTFHHEPENDGLGTPEEYAAAVEHCVGFLDLLNYPNLRVCGAALTDGGWQGAPMGKNTGRPDPHRWYAGLDGVIELVGGDHYSRYPDSGNAVESMASLAANGLKLANEMGLPYFVGECGQHGVPADNTANAAKAKWITDGIAFLESVDCAGIMYSDVDSTSPVSGKPLNYRVDSATNVTAAWVSASNGSYWS